MANLDTYMDVHGNEQPHFPPAYPFYLDMGKNAKRLKESDGYFYSKVSSC